jgi:hypothetical protein
MITTLSAMRPSRWKTWIIGMLLALPMVWMGGCSSIPLAYNNGPQLAWWWIDAYLDFSGAQTPPVKQAIDQLFDWHRSTQIALYLPLLTAAQSQVSEATTATLACRWQDQVRERLDPTLERLLGSAADLLPSLGEAQFKHLEKRYTKVLAELRDDFLQPDLAERHTQSVKRALERAERLYGRLAEPQRQVISAGVAASPFNPDLWWQERQRRQRDTVQTLRRLAADKADRDLRLAALRTLVARVERSPDATYRAYQLKLADYNCAFAAQIHNATTPAQRKRAFETLKEWESDLRLLMARE